MRTDSDSIPNRIQPAQLNKESEFGSDSSVDILGALWRYRWAVVLPAIAGAIAGFLIYLRTPETYRSTTKLMLESDRPAIFDNMTGNVVSGVPGIEIIQSQLYSDKVVSMAFDDPRMKPFREQFNNRSSQFISEVQDLMVLEPEVDDAAAQSLVMLLHFDSTNPELCEASVKSFSSALQDFLNEKQQNSRGELIRLISQAIEDLYPKIQELDQRNQKFRSEVPLTWNSDGEAINPHRERQLYLVQKRSELFEELRQKQIMLRQVETLAQRAKDPIVALNVISKLLGVSISIDTSVGVTPDMRAADAELRLLDVDEKLIPLMIERNKYAAQFGDNHPNVKQLDSELSVMKAELKRLVQQQTDRMLELIRENKVEGANPAEVAAETVAQIIYASKAEEQLLDTQIQEVDAQIETEKEGATKLARYEQQNIGMLREIDRNRELMSRLEKQMDQVSLTDDEGGTRVTELKAPSGAYIVGPNLMICLGIGTFLGLALGSGLAFLLEKNSSTFRNPDEIAEVLGVPVLTHVPFFKGRIRKAKKGEVSPYKDLDPYLAVIHQPASIPSEAIRSFRTSVFFELAGVSGGKVIQVTSPLPGDGKSTIGGNLACSIAQSGKRVLALDCDLRRPQLTDNFDMSGKPGISNVLNGDCELADACHATPLPNLFVMPSGPIPSNPAEALTLPDMNELLEEVRNEFDYIILDTPPLLVVTDPSITASMVDGVVLTVRIRRKCKPNAKESLNILRAVGAKVLGTVINNSDEAGASDGYRGYGYYRYGRYTNRYARRGNASEGSSDGSKRESMVITGRGSTARNGVTSNGTASARRAEVNPSGGSRDDRA
ncbi:polysaccharide biosynthesis tyrosine autokinase [Planctomycetes bacterium K23_9]|uniref:non-specific protein-tyrosine kinase n=1 Tax=Stieleria marina TaxID=1930275 RepID=A0A517NYQ3_9BACT|nr:Tyrosine-protein kinase ptk [Planctomycetes bacterium K23_9]